MKKLLFGLLVIAAIVYGAYLLANKLKNHEEKVQKRNREAFEKWRRERRR
jgi:predicted Holliday junction resolvase-like endonuclease